MKSEAWVPRFLADRTLAKLEDMDLARVGPFLRAYVESIVVRPLLVSGMCAEAKIPPKDAPDRRYLILVDAELSLPERLRTLFHELIHIQLFVAGVAARYHDESQIEACAIRLADRYPEAIGIFCEVFPSIVP